ncbi:hypothetical protein [Paenibacillus ehimensis]|uniref:hypothetical protein n=1 Tax=Paenibacillus ehimensis TaxID=79264 RepID=UPI000472863F|nr:hypothetical protein [Paenibacillus ehimensis]
MLQTTKINIEIDEKAIASFIERELQRQINQQLLLVDISKLSELTSMSVRYLEDEILPDPRVRIHERKKNRKRWWLAQPTLKAIEEIVNSW